MFNNKTVFISGGTGSYGNKLTEILLNEHNPKKVIIYSRGEHKQNIMMSKFNDKRLRFFIGDVRDLNRLIMAMKEVDYCFHAAALKQIHIAEYNPNEAIMTNLIGTKNIIEASIKNEVRRVVFINTDKAVNPINVYGASKLAAEKLVIAANSYSTREGTKFTAIRYGNVINSSGSVGLVFAKLRDEGKPIPITNPIMTRFFIDLERAVKLSMEIMEKGYGGEILIPKIKSASIVQIANALAPDSEKIYTGVRPGEKIHETLMNEDESRRAVEFNDYYIIIPDNFPFWEYKGFKIENTKLKRFTYKSDKIEGTMTDEEIKIKFGGK